MRYLRHISKLGIAVVLTGMLSWFCASGRAVHHNAGSLLALSAAGDADREQSADLYSELFLHIVAKDHSPSPSIHKDKPGTGNAPGLLSGFYYYSSAPLCRSERLSPAVYKQEFVPIQLSELFPFHSFW
jgi:hypothetical protein